MKKKLAYIKKSADICNVIKKNKYGNLHYRITKQKSKKH